MCFCRRRDYLNRLVADFAILAHPMHGDFRCHVIGGEQELSGVVLEEIARIRSTFCFVPSSLSSVPDVGISAVMICIFSRNT